jgi:hypothetical protein
MFSAKQRAKYQQMTALEQSRRRLIDAPKDQRKAEIGRLIDVARSLHDLRQTDRVPQHEARQALTAGRFRAPPPPSDDEFLGDVSGIHATIALRMTHIPTAMVHVFDPNKNPLVSFELQNETKNDVRLLVRTHVEGYSAHAVQTIEIKKSDKSTVPLLPTFFADRLKDLHEATRATLHVEVNDLGNAGTKQRVEEHRTFRVWVLPKTTAILWQEDPSTGEDIDLTEHLVSWVTPNSPEVMAILRQAAGSTPGRSIVSYQDESEVEAQVHGIYDAVKAKELAYINSVAAVGAEDVFVQRVRLPRESLERRSANCIDGTVLLASVIEAASMQPGIVLIPGHAFLAWRKTENGPWDFLETTMLGTHGFDDAVQVGRLTYEEAEKDATILDVATLRAKGYLPLE